MMIAANIISMTILFAVPLLLVAMGGMFSEHSGVINIALEGMMIIGALFACFTLQGLDQSGFGPAPAAVDVHCHSGGGRHRHDLLAVAGLRGHQPEGRPDHRRHGAEPVCARLRRRHDLGHPGPGPDHHLHSQLGAHHPRYLRPCPGGRPQLLNNLIFKYFYLTTPVAIVLFIAAYIVMYKTRFGLRLRACGEHPQAADSVGINVYKMRYAGVLISGFLGGVGGLAYTLAAGSGFNSDVGGYGFLALAVMIFGNWKPLPILARRCSSRCSRSLLR